jgi:hypothetical protein
LSANLFELVASVGILPLIVDIQLFRTHHCLALNASVVELQDKLLQTLNKVFQLSLINFHVLPLNKTTWLSVELAGQTTSQAPSPSLPSHTLKQDTSPSVSVMHTVVTFHALELVTQAIQFPVAPVGHWHPCGH